MQRTGKKNEITHLLILGVLIIVAIILLVQAGHAGWLFLLVPAWVVFGITSFSFWFLTGISQPINQSGFNNWLFPFWYLPGFMSPIYILQSGKLQRDYFLFKNKPRIGLLYIYPDSAAVIQAKDGQKWVLQSGFHYLGLRKEISLCFKTGINRFVIGPLADENPFDQKRSSENYTAYHSRRLRAQKVRAYTKDSREIFASFRIVYLLSNAGKPAKGSENDFLLKIATDIPQMKRGGEAALVLEEYFSRRILDLWTAKLSQLMGEEILQGGAIDQIMAEINSAMRDPAQPSARLTVHQDRASAENHGAGGEWPLPFFRVYLDMLWLQPNQSSSAEKKP